MEQQGSTYFRPYKAKMSIFWWTERLSHFRFIMRELTSLTVAFFAVVFIFYLRSLAQGPEAYAQFLEKLQSPVFIVLHILALGGLIFHSITWFNLAPKAMVVKVGKKHLPDGLIITANYAGWLIISLLIIWFFI